ncbi:hypothetical protein D8674_017889 [Pyrus ussuriensis x Pyrus communis]|uniref:Myb-like domain-containing protein n=1 Tax=Pyrus ussuriensis x Pyrus communis TaxID=2448454 RepID=A0A5N5HE09_9ROSA|nr:hypothetical protein D8674_017889 [Pyrus ussuriensis x Pyrus communis]
MATSTMKDRDWTRKEDEALCKAYRWVSKDSLKGSSQTSEGVWTHTSKEYNEFYEGTTSPNSRNHESCSSRWKKHLHPNLNKWHQAVLKAGSRHESEANYYNKVRQAEELYMEDNSKPFSHHVGDEHRSPTIQETRVENPSPGEASIPRATGQNKARKLKEKDKAKDDYAFQQEMASSLRLMVDQNAFAAEEINRRHEEWAKQIQEEMDDRNMQRNTSDYTPMSLIGKRGKLWPNGSCLHPTILLQWRMKMMIIVFKLKLL